MTSTEDRARAVMRAYADTVQPPPLGEVLDRAGRTASAQKSGLYRMRQSPWRLTLAAAGLTAIAGVVGVSYGIGRDSNAGFSAPGVAATSSQAHAGRVARLAPGCPPGLPLLEGPHNLEGVLSKPLAAIAGQSLTLPAQILPHDSDRPLLTFQIYIMPHGLNMDDRERDKAVAQSAVLKLEPDQTSVSPIVPNPTGLAAGTYDVVGYATWPFPSVCGVKNPVDSPEGPGSSWGVLGSVVVS